MTTDVSNVTYEEALAALMGAVEERGEDFVYQDEWDNDGVCKYVVDGKPACIVGNALHRLGVPTAILHEYETQGAHEVLRALDNQNGAIDLLFTEAQFAQDGGMQWGESVRAAIELTNSIYPDTRTTDQRAALEASDD